MIVVGIECFLLNSCWVNANDFALLCADRTVIERVYYDHRLGTKPPFEQALPCETIERLVRDDRRKEAALQRVYGLEVTPAMLDTEVQRITTTTRAPDVLAELKTALGHDANRFARTVAKPIVVERLLRDHFDNDDQLHAAQRRQAEQTRNEMLAAKQAGGGFDNLLLLLKRSHSNDVSETTWQLGPRPAETNAPAADLIEVQKRFGSTAQVLSSPRVGENQRKFYFEDLPDELQRVLRVQLRQPGDVSAVVEMPGGFILYVAKEKTDTVLSVARLSVPKRSCEQWLQEQDGGE